MSKFFYIFFFFLVIQHSASAKFYRDSVKRSPIDTIVKEVGPEDDTIEEILKSRSLPKKEKIQYLSQSTKYGFKNLFKNYCYNATMPHRSHVNPYAETYMQDYLQSHGTYLQRMKVDGALRFDFIDNIFAPYGLPKEL